MLGTAAVAMSGFLLGRLWEPTPELPPRVAQHASAALLPQPEPPPPLEPEPEPETTVAFAVEALPTFDKKLDEDVLHALLSKPLLRVKVNTKGSSLSLRLDFADGARAAFKPFQIHVQSDPRREVAAYRINLLLGLKAVPPAIGRSFALAELKAKLDPSQAGLASRLDRETLPKDGQIGGELSYWIPIVVPARFGNVPMDSIPGLAIWRRQLTIGEAMPDKELVMQVSQMVLFDFIINNSDRWSGDNVLASGDGRFLYFMDNTLSFGADPIGHVNAYRYLERVQRFSRQMVEKLRGLRERDLRRAMKKEAAPFGALLTEEEILAVLGRRDLALDYIDRLIQRHGEDEVLAFP
jgi:hypothetical protein